MAFDLFARGPPASMARARRRRRAGLRGASRYRSAPPAALPASRARERDGRAACPRGAPRPPPSLRHPSSRRRHGSYDPELGRVDGFVLGRGVAFAFGMLVPIVERTAACPRSSAPGERTVAPQGDPLWNRGLASCLQDISPDGRRADSGRHHDACAARDGARPRRPHHLEQRHRSPEAPPSSRARPLAIESVTLLATAARTLAILEEMLVALGTTPRRRGRRPLRIREHLLMVAKEAQGALLAERDDGFTGSMRRSALVQAMLS